MRPHPEPGSCPSGASGMQTPSTRSRRPRQSAHNRCSSRRHSGREMKRTSLLRREWCLRCTPTMCSCTRTGRSPACLRSSCRQCRSTRPQPRRPSRPAVPGRPLTTSPASVRQSARSRSRRSRRPSRRRRTAVPCRPGASRAGRPSLCPPSPVRRSPTRTPGPGCARTRTRGSATAVRRSSRSPRSGHPPSA